MGIQTQPHIEIGTKSSEKETIYYICDNETEIDPRYHKKIFNLFERLDEKNEGTDIDLALVKRIVEVHNGPIWVEFGRQTKRMHLLLYPAPK